MVDMYKSIVVFLLTGGKTLLVPVFYEDYFAATLRLLEKLHKVTWPFAPAPLAPSPSRRRSQALMRLFVWCHQVNLKAHHVEYNRFYIPDITSLVDIQEDYLKWFLNKAEIVSVTASTNVSGLIDEKDNDDEMRFTLMLLCMHKQNYVGV